MEDSTCYVYILMCSLVEPVYRVEYTALLFPKLILL